MNTNLPSVKKTQNTFATSTLRSDSEPKVHAVKNASSAPVFPTQLRGDLEAVDEKEKSMMQETENLSENLSAALKQENTFMCKVRGKEGRATHMINHVETNHLEGISIPFVFCEKDSVQEMHWSFTKH